MPIFCTRLYVHIGLGGAMNVIYLILMFATMSVNALEHKVFFTNPVCKNENQSSTFCTKHDYERNYLNPNGVFQSYVKILLREDYNKIIISYLSYSNPELTHFYKKVLLKSKPEFTIILDDPFEKQPYKLRKEILRKPLSYESFHQAPASEYLIKKNGQPISALAQAYELLKFAHENKISPSPKLLLRGQTLGSGYSHMKMTYLENNKSKKLILGSANLSQGIVLHHENWHMFTDTEDSNFVEVHKCILDLLISEPISYSKKVYSKKTNSCTEKQNTNNYKAYFTPGQGRLALKDIKTQFEKSDEIWIAAHRFSNHEIISYIKQAMEEGKTVRLLVDDDLYWVSHKSGRFLNSTYEAELIQPLINLGLKIKYVSTNQNEFLLHHNKYLIFIKNKQAIGVFTGAGNLTHSAFTKNFENYFLSTKQEVSNSFFDQYKFMWELALEANDLASNE